MNFTHTSIRTKLGSRATLLFLSFLIFSPVLYLVSFWFYPSDEAWRFFIQYELFKNIIDTILFCLGTCLLSGLIGVMLASIFTLYEFPLKRLYECLILLPMAIPAFVIGFVYLGLLEPFSPLNLWLREISSNTLSVPSLKNIWGAVLIKSLVLYPYVYLLVRSAFLTISNKYIETSYLSGYSPFQIFLKVLLPLSRPWLIGSLFLVLMESLSDFGMCALFHVDTLTVSIYSKWAGEGSLLAATRVGTLLILLVALVIIAERALQKKHRFENNVKSFHSSIIFPASSVQKVAFNMGLSFFSFITFFLPIGILLFWVIKGWGIDGVNFENFFGYFLNSLILGFLGSLVVLLFSLFFLYLKMNDGSKFSAFVVNIACSGYALPGTLLAVGVYAITFKLDTLLSLKGLLSTGLFAMLFSYFVRFFAVAWKSIDSELFRISQSIGESASLHCKSNFKIFTTIFLPMIKNGIWTGSLLVGVDIIKELPLTLMMRPLNYDTLAVKIFNYTSEGLWAPASLPALGLVAIGLIPVTILIRQTSRKMNHAKN